MLTITKIGNISFLQEETFSKKNTLRELKMNNFTIISRLSFLGQIRLYE